MSKLFQIYEDDLAELESALPQLCDALADKLTLRLRVKIRRVKTILSDIRWDYGPPSNVTRVDCDD